MHNRESETPDNFRKDGEKTTPIGSRIGSARMNEKRVFVRSVRTLLYQLNPVYVLILKINVVYKCMTMESRDIRNIPVYMQ